MYFLATNDVEEISIAKNNFNYQSAKKTADYGMKKLIDIYSKYDVEGTFYFTGTFAQKFPYAVDLAKDHGHEVGSHGYSHETRHGFDVMSPKQQYVHLYKSKKILEEIVGRVEAFRAPALRIGNTTPEILQRLGFKTDSSIASQRFDGPLTHGALNKTKWILSPRKPYIMSKRNPFVHGNSKILEVPVSALVLAYQGNTMRFSHKLNGLLGGFLFSEAQVTGKPVVFLFHPAELVQEEVPDKFKMRSNTYFGRLFADRLRRRIKLKNLGRKTYQLLDELMGDACNRGFEFLSVKNYRKKFKNDTKQRLSDDK